MNGGQEPSDRGVQSITPVTLHGRWVLCSEAQPRNVSRSCSCCAGASGYTSEEINATKKSRVSASDPRNPSNPAGPLLALHIWRLSVSSAIPCITYIRRLVLEVCGGIFRLRLNSILKQVGLITRIHCLPPFNSNTASSRTAGWRKSLTSFRLMIDECSKPLVS